MSYRSNNRIANKVVTNHFEEQFDESEIINNEVYAGTQEGVSPKHRIADGKDNSRPLPLLTLQADGELKLNEDTLEVLADYPDRVGFVVAMGQGSLGRSYLLNRLIGANSAFSSESNPNKEEGIWMWPAPIVTQHGNIFILDTIIGRRGSPHSQNIFHFVLMMASCILYYTPAPLNEESLVDLNYLHSLPKKISAASNLTSSSNEHYISEHLPHFIWVFSEAPSQVLPPHYLDGFLLDRTNQNDTAKLKRSFTSLFLRRECIGLPSPLAGLDDHSDVVDLRQVADNKIDRSYKESVANLKRIITSVGCPKSFQGQALTGEESVSLLEGFVDSLNLKGTVCVSDIWKQLSDAEGITAYNRAIQVYNEIYSNQFASEEPKGDEIHQILSNLRNQTLKEFKSNLTQSNPPFENKINDFIDRKQEAILQANAQIGERHNFELLRDLSKGLMAQVQNGKYAGQADKLNADIGQVVKSYNSKAKGDSKSTFITEFLTGMNPVIVAATKPQQDDTFKNTKKAYESKVKNMENEVQAAKLNGKSIVDPKSKKMLPQPKAAKDKSQAEKTCCIIM